MASFDDPYGLTLAARRSTANGRYAAYSSRSKARGAAWPPAPTALVGHLRTVVTDRFAATNFRYNAAYGTLPERKCGASRHLPV
jgi:hypothetical protein